MRRRRARVKQKRRAFGFEQSLRIIVVGEGDDFAVFALAPFERFADFLLVGGRFYGLRDFRRHDFGERGFGLHARGARGFENRQQFANRFAADRRRKR